MQEKIAANKKKTMELAIVNEEQKKEVKKELIMHQKNKKMRKKDYNQLLKQQNHAACTKEWQNYFRQIRNLGRMNHFVINLGPSENSLATHTGQFGKMSTLFGKEGLLCCYIKTRFNVFVKGLVQ